MLVFLCSQSRAAAEMGNWLMRHIGACGGGGAQDPAPCYEVEEPGGENAAFLPQACNR